MVEMSFFERETSKPFILKDKDNINEERIESEISKNTFMD